MNQAMVRQKHYHDRKLKWHQFAMGEEVYVFFPNRKLGTSPKFTSYWRGPYQVIKKMSDLTYLVNCGLRGSDQAIHVDRMRKKHSQVLSGESDDSLTFADPGDPGPASGDTDSNVREDIPVSHRPSRDRKPPSWLYDYETEM